MADINFSSPLADPDSRAAEAASAAPRAGDLRWDIIELLFFAYRDFVGDADHELEAFGFGRAHHRVMHFVHRYPGLKVADLLDVLRITKQSLGRVLKQLLDEGYIVQKTGNNDRRQRLLFATAKGEALVAKLAGLQTDRINRALRDIEPGRRRGGPAVPARDDRSRRSRQGAGDDLRHRANRKGKGIDRGPGCNPRTNAAATGRRRAASAAGRRRPPHPRSAVALSVRRRLPRHHRDERQGRPRQAARPAFRPADPRRDDARRNRLRSRPLHPHLVVGADHHADGAPRGGKPDRGPADRRRRLRRQAVRAARTGAADRQYPQAHRAAAGRDAGADRVRALRLSSGARRIAPGRGGHPSHRPRARHAAHSGAWRAARPCRAAR